VGFTDLDRLKMMPIMDVAGTGTVLFVPLAQYHGYRQI
jgi:hypothetical protein